MELAQLMTPNPTICPSSTSTCDAARLMRDQAIGDVLVERDGELVGIVTDRDIVTRAVAAGRDPMKVSLGEICSDQLRCVSLGTPVDEVIRIMNEGAVRRVPVMDGDQAVGIVALGDLAVASDRSSLLARISAAAPNG